MRTYTITPNLKLIDVAPSISSFEKFIGVYVLEARRTALVDVGPSASAGSLIAGLAELNINPVDIGYIFVTHIHIDHAGGIGNAIKQMPNATVVVHEKGKPHLVAPAKLWEDSQQALGELALEYGPIEPVPPDRILIAKEGMKINLGEMEIEVLSTPGHASHHLSFVDRNEGRLFAGEAGGCYTEEIDAVRPATPFPFNLEQALTSVDKLIHLNPRSLYFTHFGYTAHALDKLHYYKQQLILWGNIIADHLEKEASWQDMYNEIRKRDDALVRINSLSQEQYRRELYFIENSIMGFVGYFKKHGTEYIEQYNKERA